MKREGHNNINPKRGKGELQMKKRIFAVMTVLLTMAVMTVTAMASDPVTAANPFVVDWTGVDFTIIVDGIMAVIPFLLPVVIGFIGLRKGIQWATRTLKGA
jgi:hypothetical protein